MSLNFGVDSSDVNERRSMLIRSVTNLIMNPSDKNIADFVDDLIETTEVVSSEVVTDYDDWLMDRLH